MKDLESKRKYQREWVAARRAEFFEGKSCANCNSTNRLELHHLNPEEKIGHAIFSWSKERRDIEIAKCQILCNKCHREETSKQQRTAIHGSIRMYRRYKCRCEPCRQAKRLSR